MTWRGIGRAFSLEIAKRPNPFRASPWRKGTAYNYGIGEPNYPVLAPLTFWEYDLDPDGEIFVIAYIDETNEYAVEYVRGMLPDRMALAKPIK